MLSAFERQYEILSILYERRFETVPNLASEFHVSKFTIYKDIQMLSRYFPIYTTQGNNGGVHMMEGAKFGRVYLNEDEKALLVKLQSQLGEKDKITMQRVLDKFSLCKDKSKQ